MQCETQGCTRLVVKGVHSRWCPACYTRYLRYGSADWPACGCCGGPVKSRRVGSDLCTPCRRAAAGRGAHPLSGRLLSCRACGEFFTTTRGGSREFCSVECKEGLRHWREGRPCSRCGKRIMRSGNSGFAPVPTCQPCRRANPSPPKSKVRANTCAHCGAPCVRKFCSLACNGAAQRRRAEGDSHVTRGRRELAAPGLRRAARGRLLARWRREGRHCTYCSRPVECVDHVVPLVRGGTNHEGNLAPCCWRCNSRKSGLLVIEWRSGLRLSRRTLLPWVPRQFSPIVGEQLALDLAGW